MRRGFDPAGRDSHGVGALLNDEALDQTQAQRRRT